MTTPFAVCNRWMGDVQFTAQIECADDAPMSIKRGLAVRWAVKHVANLSNADLSDADLRGADLIGADLRGASLRGADLIGADLRGASLRGADLRRASLRGADLIGADLRGASLSRAYLSRADLSGAYLSRADLSDADLRRADLSDTDLRGANLIGADLRGASLRGADLRRADLNGAIGNMREIKSAQFDRWPITWTQPRDGEPILQIGCQKHPLSKWEASDPRWIACMDEHATAWWARYRDVVLALVKASPATPFEVKS